uniref:Protein-PII uridylyltransferase N-terminal domain-containing protein n=2 Tax=Branchiostoma floridae TaxID=7739 RepID=C3ZHS6_BRAFL|eukprot:XP_002591859.1 hypothetical protein BRAFLDRAFT_89372 [Branchiostoma floridae]
MMLRVCKELREVDVKSKRLGLVRTETDYLRALLDAMANMDRCVEVEVLKTLGDVNLEKGRLEKSPEKFDRAMVLYRTALIRCEDADVGESLEYRYHYAENLRLGKRSIPTASSRSEPLTDDMKMSSLAIAERLLHLDQRLTVDGNNETLLLVEYTKIVIEGIINGDTMLETEAIKCLGDVYLKRGTESKDATCLTKATALYNAALSRCEEFQGTVALIHRLLYTARIRQERQKTENNLIFTSLEYRVQQQSLVPRDFLMVTPNSHVIGDAKSQQSMSFEERLTTGDSALADEKLDVAEQNFASALRLIHDPNKPDRWKEAICLCRLGDVYVQRGKTTKECGKFTQAAALYNAAIARSDGNKHSMTKILQDVEQWFLHYTANVEARPSCSDAAIRHKKRLEEMRSRAKSQLDAIDQQHNPYQYDEDDPVMIKVEAERAEAVKNLCKNIAKDRQGFIQDLIDECIATVGPPPCKYAFIGLGSQATELVTPYSDLEFAILIEEGKDNDDTRRYFINLTHYLHLKVINLGETILPAMAIPSLNDFLSEDPVKDWFFDSATPRGFAFDGFMPWASKTPFGRDQTKTKPPVSLIQTPAEMAKFQQIDVSLAEGYHLSDILRRVVFLTGEEALVTDYRENLKEIITGDLQSRSHSRLSAMQIAWGDGEQFSTSLEPSGQLLNVKKDIYRFPGIAIEVLALCYQITLASAWNIIDELKLTSNVHEENATHLKVLTSISAELRLRTYLANGGQQDTMSPLVEMKYDHKQLTISGTTLRSTFHIEDTMILFRYYDRAIPLMNCISDIFIDSSQVQPKMVLKTVIFDTSNECRGRIAIKLIMSDKALRHLEAALNDAGSNLIKRSEILEELGQFWNFRGNFTKAASLFEQSLRIRKQVYGDNTAHHDIAESLYMGLSWSNLGDQKKAINYKEQALVMTKAVYGESTAHPCTARTLKVLGSAWRKLGDQKKAISYYEQSLEMEKTIYGDNTICEDIARTLLHLGISWSELGVPKKAISYGEQALTMYVAIYGDNTVHPDMAASLNNVGSYWRSLGDLKKAISYFEQSRTMMAMIHGDSTAHPLTMLILDNLGSSWSELGDRKEAIGHYEQALAMMKTVFGDDTAHRYITTTLTGLGFSWSELGDEEKAISYYEQSLTMMKTMYGDNTVHSDIAKSLTMKRAIHGDNTAHLDIARSLNNLGASWYSLGNQEKAISYFEQSLRTKEAIYGDNTGNWDIVSSLNNLGSAWGELGEQKTAISYYERALTMMKTIHEENTAHPDIVSSLNSLGSAWSELDDKEKALSYYEQALSMQKSLYGDTTAHADIASTLNHLGSVWSELDDQEKAISYYEQALTIMKTIHGDNTAHPDIAPMLYNLGEAWDDVGDQEKAIFYYEQALSIDKSMYGENTAHPDIASTLSHLGEACNELGEKEKAINYYEQALSTMKAIYGDDTAHPDIASTLNNLGAAWGDLGDQEKAITYYEQALSIEKTIFGDDTAHPEIARTLYNLGFSFSDLDDHEKAIIYYEQSLTMDKTIHGENTAHIDIAMTLTTLGLSWSELGDQKKAISYYEQALTMEKSIYGENTAHADIAASLEHLALAWSKIGDQKKATEYKERSQNMSRELDN